MDITRRPETNESATGGVTGHRISNFRNFHDDDDDGLDENNQILHATPPPRYALFYLFVFINESSREHKASSSQCDGPERGRTSRLCLFVLISPPGTLGDKQEPNLTVQWLKCSQGERCRDPRLFFVYSRRIYRDLTCCVWSDHNTLLYPRSILERRRTLDRVGAPREIERGSSSSVSSSTSRRINI